MGRAPCCEKMGLKRGPWTAEEDRILVSHIQTHGHGNWRALPKQAGLLRCGKSCRLRWINYLRPDVKRGNFTAEEEETILSLHEKLGNKWSAIAARLPGRTDNEIKNVWHTYLKKRVNPTNPETKRLCKAAAAAPPPLQSPGGELSCSGTESNSSSSTRGDEWVLKASEEDPVDFLGLDESFWKDVFSVEEDYQIPAVDGGGGADGAGGRFLSDEFLYDPNELDFLLALMADAGDSPAF